MPAVTLHRTHKCIDFRAITCSIARSVIGVRSATTLLQHSEKKSLTIHASATRMDNNNVMSPILGAVTSRKMVAYSVRGVLLLTTKTSLSKDQMAPRFNILRQNRSVRTVPSSRLPLRMTGPIKGCIRLIWRQYFMHIPMVWANTGIYIPLGWTKQRCQWEILQSLLFTR